MQPPRGLGRGGAPWGGGRGRCRVGGRTWSGGHGGQGGGRGQGWSFTGGARGGAPVDPPDPQAEARRLKDQAAALEAELARVRERLDDFSAKD
jgi:hypothetical protein